MPYSLTEEPIETGRRHVLQGECLVAGQMVVVERLRSKGHLDLAAQADSVLDTLVTSLTLARDDLATLEGRNSPSFLDLVARRLARGPALLTRSVHC